MASTLNRQSQTDRYRQKFNDKTRLTPVVKLWSNTTYMVYFSANNNSKGDLGSVMLILEHSTLKTKGKAGFGA